MAETLEKLEKISVKVTLPKGARFDPSNIYYLRKGIATLTHLTRDGKQSSFLFFREGMLLNFMYPVISSTGIGSEITMRRFSALDHAIFAKTECKCFCIEGEKFLAYTEKDLSLCRLLLRSISENLINVLSLSTALSTQSASLRVCQVLLQDMSDDDPPRLPSYLTYDEIAFYLSLHSITVTKIFKALRAEGIVRKRGRTCIVTDKNKLRDIGAGRLELKY